MQERSGSGGTDCTLPPPKQASALLPARLVPSGVLGRGIAGTCWLSDGSRAAKLLLTVSRSCVAAARQRTRFADTSARQPSVRGFQAVGCPIGAS